MNRLRIASVFVALFSHFASAETIVITADRMFDAESGNVSGPVVVVIEDGLIAAINPDEAPDGA